MYIVQLYNMAGGEEVCAHVIAYASFEYILHWPDLAWHGLPRPQFGLTQTSIRYDVSSNGM